MLLLFTHPFDHASLINSLALTLTVRWSTWPSKLAGCLLIR